MRLTRQLTYLIIAGVIINLVGRVVYFSTHPFILAVEQPKLFNLAFGILTVFVFYIVGNRFEERSAKNVFYSLCFAALLRSVSYVVNGYLPDQWAVGLLLYLLVVAAEIAVLYFCALHL
jgi:hypothetical protein